jgi:7-cyano-7-deazaguanine synthase
MLLQGLVACAGVTMQAVATALGIELRGGNISAKAISISAARSASPKTPCRLQIHPPALRSRHRRLAEQLTTLMKLTEALLRRLPDAAPTSRDSALTSCRCRPVESPAMTCQRRPAIVLLSGGLDSATCLAIARATSFLPLYTMSFDYGQRHRHELAAAEKLAKQFGVVEHRVIKIDLRQFGRSALTADIAVPKDRDESQMTADIPIYLRPRAQHDLPQLRPRLGRGARRPRCLHRRQRGRLLRLPRLPPRIHRRFRANGESCHEDDHLGCEVRPFKIHTPLINLKKSQIIRRGVDLGVDYS